MKIHKPSFSFFGTKSPILCNSYPKRTLVAMAVVLPIAYGLNIPLNSMFFGLPTWSLILINVLVIPSYVELILPRITKSLHSWIYPKKCFEEK